MSDTSTRVQRVQRELLQLLTHFLMHDWGTPLPCYASITAVDVTGDLRSARVFFRLVGSDEVTREAEDLLRAGRGAFQKCVAAGLRMKFSPVLRFEFGRVPQQDEIDVLLENLHRPKNFED